MLGQRKVFEDGVLVLAAREAEVIPALHLQSRIPHEQIATGCFGAVRLKTDVPEH